MLKVTASLGGTKAMAMGREGLPPEDADTYEEFRARLEQEEAAAPKRAISPLWSGLVGLLIPADIIFGLKGAVSLPLKLGVAVVLVAILVMAMRTFRRTERQQARVIELDRLRNAWQESLGQRSPSL
jgi:TRAP-type C4-dicarboxylate transport system permease large subunit